MGADDGAKPSVSAVLREGSEDGIPKEKRRKENASTGTYAATMRALSARLFAFYFRAPVKAFFRARVDYMVRFHISDSTSYMHVTKGVRATLGQSILVCEREKAGPGE